MEKKGLNKKDDTAAQSSVTAPRPKPCMTKPICRAMTEVENAQQIHEMFVSVGKRYPGIVYHAKLQTNTITKNIPHVMCRFPSFSCKALQNIENVRNYKRK